MQSWESKNYDAFLALFGSRPTYSGLGECDCSSVCARCGSKYYTHALTNVGLDEQYGPKLCAWCKGQCSAGSAR